MRRHEADREASTGERRCRIDSGLASGTHHLRNLTGPPSETSTRHTRLLPVVGVGEVDPRRGDVVELLARSRRGLRDVDDLQYLGTAEAGDLHGTHAVRLGVVTTSVVDGASG